MNLLRHLVTAEAETLGRKCRPIHRGQVGEITTEATPGAVDTGTVGIRMAEAVLELQEADLERVCRAAPEEVYQAVHDRKNDGLKFGEAITLTISLS